MFSYSLCDITSFLFVAALLGSCPQITQGWVCPSGWWRYQSSCYLVKINDQIAQTSAKSNCEDGSADGSGINGALVGFSDTDEETLIHQLTLDSGEAAYSVNYWIGLLRDMSETGFPYIYHDGTFPISCCYDSMGTMLDPTTLTATDTVCTLMKTDKTWDEYEQNDCTVAAQEAHDYICETGVKQEDFSIQCTTTDYAGADTPSSWTASEATTSDNIYIWPDDNAKFTCCGFVTGWEWTQKNGREGAVDMIIFEDYNPDTFTWKIKTVIEMPYNDPTADTDYSMSLGSSGEILIKAGDAIGWRTRVEEDGVDLIPYGTDTSTSACISTIFVKSSVSSASEGDFLTFTGSEMLQCQRRFAVKATLRDNPAPTWVTASWTATDIDTDTPISTDIFLLEVSDSDVTTGIDSLAWTIVSSPTSDAFIVGQGSTATQASVMTTRTLDSGDVNSYTLVVTVADGCDSEITGTITIDILLATTVYETTVAAVAETTVEDTTVVVTTESMTTADSATTVTESVTEGTTASPNYTPAQSLLPASIVVSAHDTKIGDVVWSMSTSDVTDLEGDSITIAADFIVPDSSIFSFAFDGTTAEITALVDLGTMDYISDYIIGFTFSDGVNDPTGPFNLTIEVNDFNHRPTFDSDQWPSTPPSIDESTAAITKVTSIYFSDGDNDTLTVDISSITLHDDSTLDISSYPFTLTKIDDSEAELYTTASPGFDFETAPYYTITFNITDDMHTGLDKSLVININDVNEAPSFTQSSYNRIINEGSGGTSTGIDVNTLVTDPDSNDQLTFSVDNSYFEIDTTGILRYAIDYDIDDGSTLSTNPSIVVSATDQGGNVAAATISLDIRDINDETPEFSAPALYKTSLTNNAVVGTVVTIVSASDRDRTKATNALVRYRIDLNDLTDAGGYFTVDETTGVIRVAHQLDMKPGERSTVTVTAYDNGIPELSSSAMVLIDIPFTISMSTTTVTTTTVTDPNDLLECYDENNLKIWFCRVEEQVLLGVGIALTLSAIIAFILWAVRKWCCCCDRDFHYQTRYWDKQREYEYRQAAGAGTFDTSAV